jgi:hypothetical protein
VTNNIATDKNKATFSSSQNKFTTNTIKKSITTRGKKSFTFRDDNPLSQNNNTSNTVQNQPNFKAHTLKNKRMSMEIKLKPDFYNAQVDTPVSSASTPKVNTYNSNPTLFGSAEILTTNYSENREEIKQPQIESKYILDSIEALGSLVKVKNSTPSTETKVQIDNLNNQLSQIKTIGTSNVSKPQIAQDESNLLNENNIIKRETFIDNNFNKKETREKIINEIHTTSDLRMKKYNILFDFINNNIKEITEMVSQSNTTQIMYDGIKEESPKPDMPNMLHDISNSFAESNSEIDFYKNFFERVEKNKATPHERDKFENTINLDSFAQDSFFKNKFENSSFQVEKTLIQFEETLNRQVNETLLESHSSLDKR